MALNQPFTTTSPTLVNFDFQDVLANGGHVRVFAMIDLANSQTLVRQQIESDEFRVSFSPTTPGLQGEHNFDFEFETPTRLNGKCFITITLFATAVSTQTANCTVKIRLIHVDTAAAETEIAAQQASAILAVTADGSTEWNNTTFSFDIDGVHFAKGEKFRAEIEVHSDASSNVIVGYYIDPANRDFGQTGLAGAFLSTVTPSSQLEILLPTPLEQ